MTFEEVLSALKKGKKQFGLVGAAVKNTFLS